MIGPRTITAVLVAGLVFLAPGLAHADTPPRVPAVLLVTQTSDGARWAPVVALLQALDLKVTTVPAPAGSEAALRESLLAQDGPVVLVASGLSGAVMTKVADDAKVAALVYVAALAPEAIEATTRPRQRFYAVAEQDALIPPALQRLTAARMKAKTIVLDRVESHPRKIAGLILEAAGMQPPACGAAGDNGTGACAAPALPRSLANGCKCTKQPLDALTAP